MAISTKSSFVFLEENRVTKSNYFIVTGTVINKHLFRANLTPVVDDILELPTGDIIINKSITDSDFLLECHNKAIEVLQNLNPELQFNIVDL